MHVAVEIRSAARIIEFVALHITAVNQAARMGNRFRNQVRAFARSRNPMLQKLLARSAAISCCRGTRRPDGPFPKQPGHPEAGSKSDIYEAIRSSSDPRERTADQPRVENDFPYRGFRTWTGLAPVTRRFPSLFRVKRDLRQRGDSHKLGVSE